jgi:mRNA interferase HigB
MRVIKESFLREMAAEHPRAGKAIEEWIAVFRAATFANPVEMRDVFPSVDPVIVKSGHTVYVFNIRHNEFRLIAAIHFNRQIVFTLRFLSHAEYDRAHWKNEL